MTADRSSIRIDRHAVGFVLTAALAFACAAVFVTLLAFLLRFAPPGIGQQRALASLTVTEPGKQPGLRISLLERIGALPGVAAVYAARPTRRTVEIGSTRLEVGMAFVSRAHFEALGVTLQGAGFSAFAPWQRGLERECVLSQRLASQLRQPDGSGPVGVLTVDGSPCRIVGVVSSTFAGLRPPRRDDLWMSWPSMRGLGVPEVAPDEFLDYQMRPRESGLVLTGERPLPAIERDIQSILAEETDSRSTVALSASEGLDPAEREGLVRQVNILLVSTLTVILVIACFAIASAVWRAERRRADLAVRMVHGATRRGLAVSAAVHSLRLFGVAAVLGAVAALIAYRLLIASPSVAGVVALLPAWPSVAGWAAGAITLVAITLGVQAAEFAAIVRLPVNALRGRMQAFAATSRIERWIAAIIVAAVSFSALLILGLWHEHRALAAVDRGFSADHLRVFSYQPATSAEQAMLFHSYRLSSEALLADLEAAFGRDKVALASSLPYRWERNTRPTFIPDSRQRHSPLQTPVNYVSAGFFRLLGLRFVEGRGFDPDAAGDIVISQSAAELHLGDPPWVGRLIHFETAMGADARRVAGVVADVRYRGREDASSAPMYLPLPASITDISIAVDADAAGAERRVPDILASHGVPRPLMPMASLADLAADAEGLQRFRARMIALSCGLALILGMVGLSAMLSTVSHRRLRELALKAALGAGRRTLLLDVARPLLLSGALGALAGMLLFQASLRLGWIAVAGRSGLLDAAAVLGFMAITGGVSMLPVMRKLTAMTPSRLLASE